MVNGKWQMANGKWQMAKRMMAIIKLIKNDPFHFVVNIKNTKFSDFT